MLFKKIYIFLFIIFAFFILAFFVKAETNSTIYFFYGTGCPHCQLVENYFTENNLYSKYQIEKKEIYFNRDNATFYNQALDKLNFPQSNRGVPAVVIGEKVIIGDRPIIENLIKEADLFIENKNVPTKAIDKQKYNKQNFGLTLAAVIGASTVDAINPCAFAVLIILMSTILATGNGKKALKTGLAFSTSIFISYFLMGIGFYKALTLGNLSLWFFKTVGWLAVILGLLNLKDYFWYGRGFLMEVPMSWRPRLKGLISSVTNPKGAFVIGFLVSLFLLPCTSGPYIVILGMLAKNSLDLQAILYLILYNLIFILPMILISFAVYKGFDPSKAEEIRQKQLRTLHLIAGLIMIAMGFVILFGWI
ncbi:MAG: cytochrome c biogenesis protein [bacterium]